MFTGIHTQPTTSLSGYIFSMGNYQVRDIMQLFYKASHKTTSSMSVERLLQLEQQVVLLQKQQSSQKGMCRTVQSQWDVLLKNVIQAVSQFETSYKENCPCAGWLPSPFIKRLRRLQKGAQRALLYMKV